MKNRIKDLSVTNDLDVQNNAQVVGNLQVTGNITTPGTVDGVDVSQLKADHDAHEASATAHTAAEIVNTPVGNVAATTVQAAINELQTDIDTRAAQTAFDAHVNDTADAHDASAISTTAIAGLAGGLASDVQTVAGELKSQVDTKAAQTDLNAHTGSTTAHNADAIARLAGGGIAATNVDAALAEIQGNLNTHSNATAAHGATGAVMGTTNTQTMTNKSVGDALTFTELAASPAAPAAGGLKIFAKDDQKVYMLDSTGKEKPVGSGSGSGGINYLGENGDAENGIGLWTTFDDGAALTDGTGGVPGVTFGVTTTAPLRGLQSYLFTKPAADHLNEGFAIDLTVDPIDKNKKIYISADIEVDAGYVVDDLQFAMYEKTALKLYKQGEGSLKVSVVNGRLQASFPVGTDTSLRFIGFVANANTNAFTVKLDNISIGPTKLLDVPIITEWQTFTPAWTAVTTNPAVGNGNLAGFYRRVNDTMEGRIYLTAGSTTSFGSGVWEFAVPDGLTANFSKLSNTGTAPDDDIVVGSGSILDDGSNRYPVEVYVREATKMRLRYHLLVGTTAGSPIGFNAAVHASAPYTWATNDRLVCEFTYPITEWANSSALMSTTDLMNQSAAVAVSSSTGVAIGTTNTKVTWNAPDYDRTGAWSNNSFTVQESGMHKILGYLFTDAEAFAAGGFFVVYLYKNGVQFKVLDHKYFDAAITQRADASINAGFYLNKGEVIDIYARSSVATNLYADAAFNHLSITRDASLDFIGITGETDFKEAYGSSALSVTGSGAWQDIASISLEPGEWDIVGFVSGYNSATATETDLHGAITTYSGNTATGQEVGKNKVTAYGAGTQYNKYFAHIPRHKVTVTATTTYYLKSSFSSATVTGLNHWHYNINARKIK